MNSEVTAVDSTATQQASPCNQPVYWEEYQKTSKFFRTKASFRWFRQQHGDALVKAGALAIIGGRLFVVPAVFDATVLAIGVQLAAARAA